MPIFWERYLTLMYTLVLREDDVEVVFDVIAVDTLNVSAEGYKTGKRLEPSEKSLRHFLQAKDIEISIANERERAVEFLISEQHIPRINMHDGLSTTPGAEFFFYEPAQFECDEGSECFPGTCRACTQNFIARFWFFQHIPDNEFGILEVARCVAARGCLARRYP